MRLVGALVLPLMADHASRAADIYVRPFVELSGSYDNNPALEVDKNLREGASSYGTDLRLDLGIRTPRAQTVMTPRIVWTKFPGKDVLENRWGSFDVQSDYRSERSDFSFHAKYDRRESFFLVLPDAGFSTVDPNDPNVDANGAILARNTRTVIQLRPQYQYLISQRMGFGIEAMYSPVRYDRQFSNAQQDYDYAESNVFLLFNPNPLSTWTIGPSASRFQTTDKATHTNSYGLMLGWNRKWNDRFNTAFEINASHNETTIRTTTPDQTDSGQSYAASIDMAYNVSQLSQLRLLLGRSIYPGSAGSLYQVDQLNLQYTHNVTPRVSIGTAARYLRPRFIAAHGDAADTSRDTADSHLWARWNWTRTLYLEGGYEFRWRGTAHTGVNTGAAGDHSVFLSIGYAGLPPRYR